MRRDLELFSRLHKSLMCLANWVTSSKVMLKGIHVSQDSAPLIQIVSEANWNAFLEKQNDWFKRWYVAQQFKPKEGRHCLIPGDDGALAGVLVGVSDKASPWAFGQLPNSLPKGAFRLDPELSDDWKRAAITGWALGAYKFQRYLKSECEPATLLVEASPMLEGIERIVSAITLVRDLINTPAADMNPAALAQACVDIANQLGAQCSVIEGDALLKEGYPAVHAVGRAAASAPRLIDLRWGDASKPKVVLVGKGVCFDSGGLNIKPDKAMRLMKKDMGGAAHALALAQLIIQESLPVSLRLLIPAVENSPATDAMRPGDVLATRKGLSVEVGHTDAEGRLILCDALEEASRDNPALIIDFSTLTGAARVALGTELPALFTNNETLASDLAQAALEVNDPIWRLPLWQPYKRFIESSIADLNNDSSSPYGGAITAALFLEHFIKPGIAWAHFDLMAWNTKSEPGRPEGGEAMALRACFQYLKHRFGAK